MKFYKGNHTYSKMIQPLMYIETFPEMTEKELSELSKEMQVKAPTKSNVIHFDFKNRTKL